MIGRLNFAGLVLALLTVVAAVAWAFPLVWAILTTVAPEADGTPLDGLAVYARALFGTPIGLWYLNSLVTSGTVTLVVIGISAAAGYAISQLEFWGRKALWYLILASFMIPVQALIVNHFLLMNSWKLINTWAGVILPQLIAPIAVIVYKQFFDSVPRELSEAAKVDGASHARVLWSIYLPVNWGGDGGAGDHRVHRRLERLPVAVPGGDERAADECHRGDRPGRAISRRRRAGRRTAGRSAGSAGLPGVPEEGDRGDHAVERHQGLATTPPRTCRACECIMNENAWLSDYERFKSLQS
jgi:hypothetical protein